jgi:hypothetical protein
MLLSLPITSYRQQPNTTCHPTTMFRHLCLLAVAFLAVSDARNNTTRHIKDSKPCGGNGNKKTKTAVFCVNAFTGFLRDPSQGNAIGTITQGPLFDCDDNVSGHWAGILVSFPLFCISSLYWWSDSIIVIIAL